MYYTLPTATEALDTILSQCESGDISDLSVTEETIHLLRQALYALQAEEAREEEAEEEPFENREGDPAFNGAFTSW
jgi:hypothetical protein